MGRTIPLRRFACCAAFLQLVGASWGHDDIALRDAENVAYEVKVLNSGVELEVSGPIGYGLAKEVRSALDTNPGVGLIRLDSKGGRVVEARKLRDLIMERHLSTYTVNECFSACVIAY